MIKVLITSTRWGAYSAICVFIEGWNVTDLITCQLLFFHIFFHRAKIKSARRVCTQPICLFQGLNEREYYLVIFFVVNPRLHAPRSIATGTHDIVWHCVPMKIYDYLISLIGESISNQNILCHLSKQAIATLSININYPR